MSVIGRVVALLSAFRSPDDVLGYAELARRSNLPKSTVFRLAGELVDRRLLERDGSKVRLGLLLFELGQRVVPERDLREAALPHMADLRAATRQTVHLATLDGLEVVYVEIVRAQGSPAMPSRVGGRLPAHATGVGKAMLAFSSTEHVQLLLSQKLARVSVRTIVTPDVLLRELEEIAKIGVAYDREESAAGVGCVAAPIFGPEGVVGAISASGYLDRMDLTRVASGVHTSALALSRELGGKQVALGAKPSVASLPSNRATQSGMTTPQSGASRRSMVKRKTVQDRH